MKAVTRVTLLDEDQQKFFGEGPCRLLRAIEERGSLRAAAISMEMAYSKALRILKHAEDVLAYPLTTRAIGGKDGGGSVLTPEGKAFLARYELWRDSCAHANRDLFRAVFETPAHPRIGCIVMASGMGKRFGGNKLMAGFAGKPMILWTLDATEGLYDRRIVLTRSDEAAQLCRDHGIPVIRHELPHRNDAIRLGLAAMGKDIDGCVFCAADQPLVSPGSLKRLSAAFSADPHAIHRLAFGGSTGAPALFPAWCFPELMNLPESRGGGVLMEKYPEYVRNVQADAAHELMDVDTPDALMELEKRFLSKQHIAEPHA